MAQPTADSELPPRIGPVSRAAIAYAVLLILLFYRLLAGNVLTPAALAGVLPPFHISQSEFLLNVNRIQGDVWTQFIPWQFEQYRRHAIPQWNPCEYCGFPVFANGQSEFLNPTHWIYYFVNPDWARGPMAALRLWVSAMAMFLFLRRCRLGQLASFLGGAVWTLSAFNIRWLLWPHTDSTLPLPILLLALDCFLSQPTHRHWACIALAGTLVGLSGHPGTQTMVAFIAALFVMVRLASQRVQGAPWPTLVRRTLACIAAAPAALAGAAAALLPLALQIRGSYELTQSDRGLHALDAKMLWLFLTPNIFGWPRGLHDYSQTFNYSETCCWFGLIPLALALSAIFSWIKKESRIGDLGSGIFKEPKHPAPRLRLSIFQFPNPLPARRGQIPDSPLPTSLQIPARLSSPKSNPKSEIPDSSLPAFAILLALVSLALAFGALAYLPLFRNSELGRATSLTRMFVGVHFAGAILAAMGADELFQRATPRRFTPLLCLLVLTAFAWAYTLISHPEQYRYLQALAHQPWPAIWLDSSFRVWGGLIIATLACATLAAILCTCFSTHRLVALLPIAFTAIVLLDLLWVAWDYNPIIPPNLAQFPLPPAIRQIITSGVDSRVAATGAILVPNLSTLYNFRDPRGYDLPKSQRLGDLLFHLRLNPTYITMLQPPRIVPAMDTALASWLNRCSVSFLVSDAHLDQLRVASGPPADSLLPGPAPQVDHPWPLVQQTPACSIYANPNACPRAFIPTRAFPATPAQALHSFLDPAIQFQQTSIYESPQSSAVPPTPPNAAGTVRITTDNDEEVALDVITPTGGLVVLTDSVAPGWTVTVYAAPAIPLTANYLFRAVNVPAGHHTVHWSYQTPGLRAGAAVSSLTLIMLLCLTIRNAPNASPRKHQE